jgi:predicted hotdog family 3-hydroxylacyl-ACP dehydratase
MPPWFWRGWLVVELDLCAEEYLPQKGSMCLLDRIIAADDESLVATTVFRPDSLFCRDGRIGSWVSLECMAQAIAAWAGYQGHLRGTKPRIGFLLGTNRFDCQRPWLDVDQLLRIEVRKEIQVDDGLGQFSGQTFDNNELVASAVMTVFSPEDPVAVIRGAGNG